MKRPSKLVMAIGLLLFIALGSFGVKTYLAIYGSNVADSTEKHEIFIPRQTDFNTLKDMLVSEGVIRNADSFEMVAGLMKYKKSVKPGRFLIEPGWSNRSLIQFLRRGDQSPVKVTITKNREMRSAINKAAKDLNMDSILLYQMLESDSVLNDLGTNQENVVGFFLADTYEFFWNTNEERFLQRMKKEYHKFWNKARTHRVKTYGLSPSEAIVLASIVDEETTKVDEMADIAGVYLNRLEKGWKLQADPTVKFANGDWAIRRVLNKHLEKDSPYNTYMYEGLPPGPICLPSKQSINAVINAADHDYFYFCAKDDFSGYHKFSKTLSEHLLAAKRYRSELNQRNIR